MKRFLAVVCILVAALVLTEAARTRREDKYTTKYDNINIDEILASNRLVDSYVKCLLDQGRCSPEGTELKSHISEALQKDCDKCSERQKQGAEKVIKFLYNKKPEEWKLLQNKYDPDDTYAKKYEKSLKDISE